VRRSLIAAGIAVLATVAVAGCNSPKTGTPSATTPSDPSSTTAGSSSQANLYGAPHVAVPLDTSKFQSNPCNSIAAAQLDALNIGAITKLSNANGPTCQWSSDTDPSKSGATVTYVTNGSGLASLYSAKSTYAVFNPVSPIDGYPAVIAIGNRAQGECVMAVGVSDSLAVAVALTVNSGQYQADPCTPNQQLAADVVSNIKNGGS
jgi:hypothetical protein